MGDYMKCDKCGYLLIDGDNFCRNCGKTITVNPVIQHEFAPQQVQSTVNNNIKDDNRSANMLCMFSLLLYFLAPIVFVVLDIIIALVLGSNYIGISGFAALSRVAGFILMIVARVKYPNNMFAKVLMWIYIALIVAGLLFGLIIVLFIILALISL